MVRPPQPTHRGGRGNIMCTCSIFVCRHKNNDMSTLLGHAHTYIPTDRQTDTQAYIHKSIQTYSYTYTWLHMCDVSPLWGGGVGGNQGGLDHILTFNGVSTNKVVLGVILDPATGKVTTGPLIPTPIKSNASVWRCSRALKVRRLKRTRRFYFFATCG